MIIGEWTQDTMREVKLDEQNRVFKINGFLDCGSRANAAAGTFLFECDNPMDMQWGADGAFYLLTYGNGFNVISPDAGMYKWEYVKGKRPPKAVLTTDRTDGPSPLTVNFSSAGSLDEDPGDSIRFEWNFGDGSPISTEPNPTHTYTQRGRFTAVLTVFDSSGEKTSTSTIITSRQHDARRSRVDAPLDGGLFSFGDELAFKVTVTDPEDPSINCNDIQVKFVLGHDTHGHELISRTGCTRLPADRRQRRVARRQRVRRDQAVYTDKGAAGGVPPLTTHQPDPDPPEAPGGRARRHPVRDEHGDQHRRRGGRASRQPRDGDWLQLNGPFNLFQIDSVTFRVADVPPVGMAQPRVAGSPLAAIEVRHGLADRSDRDHREPGLDRQHRGRDGLVQPDVPDRAVRQARAVLRVPVGDRRRDRRQPVQPQLGRVRRQRRDASSRPTAPGDVGGDACRRRWRCRSARRRRSARSRRASRGPTTRA